MCDAIEKLVKAEEFTTVTIVLFFLFYWVPLWVPIFIGFHSLFLIANPSIMILGFLLLIAGTSFAID